jgi:hypothetical protein
VLAWAGRPPGILPEWDQARYAVLGKTAASFRYVDEYLPQPVPHQLYPPGYPALLGIWGSAVGWRFDLMVLFSVAGSVLALALLAAVARRLWAPVPALIALAVLAVNPLLLLMAGMISSEPPYMLASLAALWLAGDDARRRTVAAGAAAVLAGLIRTAGIAAAGAVGLEWLLRRRWRPAAVFAVAAGLSMGGWLLWTWLGPTQHVGTTYIADLTQVRETGARDGPIAMLARRVADNAPRYVGIDIPLALPLPTVPGTPVDNLAIAVLVTVSLAVGTVVLCRKWRVGGIYLLAYAAMLALWPWRHSRFLVPVLPLIVLALLWGLDALVRAVRPRWALPVLAGLAAVAVVTGAFQTRTRIAQWHGCRRGTPMPEGTCLWPEAAGFLDAMRFIREQAPTQAIFVTSKSPELFWYTQRRSVRREDAMAAPPEAFVDYLRRSRVDYVLLASVHAMDFERLPARLAPGCGHFRVAFAAAPTTFVLALAPEAAPADSSACHALETHRQANRNRKF